MNRPLRGVSQSPIAIPAPPIMQDFAELYAALDETNKTTEKVAALVRYFRGASPADAAWAVWFLTGHKPRQVVPAKLIRAWATEAAGLPDWLFAECYDFVGDLAETVALLVNAESSVGHADAPPAETRTFPALAAGTPAAHISATSAGTPPPATGLAHWVEQKLLPLRTANENARKAALLSAWRTLPRGQAYVWNKLITGSFRVGVSSGLVVRALAEVSGLATKVIAHRLMGDRPPTPASWSALMAPNVADTDISRPYPFFLASPLEGVPADELGSLADWLAEWKWDGIRCQLIRRAGQSFLWTRGEELVTERFPDLAELAARMPDGTVIDGEILSWGSGDGPLPFARLQRRLNRKTVGKKLLAEVPVVLMAYDLLEWQGADLREKPLTERRALLEALAAELELQPGPLLGQAPVAGRLRVSPLVEAPDWPGLTALRATCRDRGVEGLMLKRLSSPYRVGRVRGDWWKWKIAPLTVDAVLLYAQRGHGKRAGLYTDYTFGVWDGDKLVSFAKAYGGLSDEEIRRVDRFINENTLEKFGPVRTVRPELVFELGFEGLARSRRHKSGIAVRFPRMLRLRPDKRPTDADRLERILALLPPE